VPVNDTNCPLCKSPATLFYAEHYYHCGGCDLIYLHKDLHLSPADEKAQYDLHQNSPEDSAYRQFLSQLIKPLLTLQPAPAKALDFGCGPGPTVAVMLREAGFDCSNYDPIYFDQPAVLNEKYQIITATEVFEHLANPDEVIGRLCGTLAPGGYLGIMTALHLGESRFAGWHYKNDPTHITFYSEKTLRWIEKKFALKIVHQTARVVIFKSI